MNLLKVLLSIPKTIYLNFRFLPFEQAVRFPLFVSYDTDLYIEKGAVIRLKIIRFAILRMGFHRVPICGNNRSSITIKSRGVWELDGETHIGVGSNIFVDSNAFLKTGDKFAISSASQINCFKKIIFGYNIQFSWDCLVMDSDTHNIISDSGEIVNEAKEIIFGDNIWIGCRSTILKGAIVPSNSVVGSCALVSGNKYVPNSIIIGIPARSVKTISSWSL